MKLSVMTVNQEKICIIIYFEAYDYYLLKYM